MGYLMGPPRASKLHRRHTTRASYHSGVRPLTIRPRGLQASRRVSRAAAQVTKAVAILRKKKAFSEAAIKSMDDYDAAVTDPSSGPDPSLNLLALA